MSYIKQFCIFIKIHCYEGVGQEQKNILYKPADKFEVKQNMIFQAY